MIIQRTSSHNSNRTISVGSSFAHVRAVTSITRQLYPELFPGHGFDPVGRHILGETHMLHGIEYEAFPLESDTDTVSVPKALTDHVRRVFDGKVLWRAAVTPGGGRAYAVLGNNIVAVVGDGTLEVW